MAQSRKGNTLSYSSQIHTRPQLTNLARPRSIKDVLGDPNTPAEYRWGYGLGPWAFGYKINEGGAATVYRAWHGDQHRRAAVKIVRLNATSKRPSRLADSIGDVNESGGYGMQKMWKRVMREMSILMAVSHPNIVELFDVWQCDKQIYFFMEEGHTDLDEYTPKGGFEHQKAVNIFGQILCAVSYLHSMGICHRDLKPHNVILTALNRVKLIDFGLAAVQHDEHFSISVGTVIYMAPEVWNIGLYDGKKADMWSLGILLFTLLTGLRPAGDNPDAILKGIMDGTWKKFFEEKGVRQNMKEMVANLLSEHPAERPSARPLVELDIFYDSRKDVPLDYKITRHWDNPTEGIWHQLRSVFHKFGGKQLWAKLHGERLTSARIIHQGIKRWWEKRVQRLDQDLQYSHDPRIIPMVNTGISSLRSALAKRPELLGRNPSRSSPKLINRSGQSSTQQSMVSHPNLPNSITRGPIPQSYWNNRSWAAGTMSFRQFQRLNAHDLQLSKMRSVPHRAKLQNMANDRLRVVAPHGELTNGAKVAKLGLHLHQQANGPGSFRVRRAAHGFPTA